jgi:hypothetical protein
MSRWCDPFTNTTAAPPAMWSGDPFGSQLASALGPEEPPQAPTDGLPLAPLLPRALRSTAYYVITTIDARGRIADRSPLRVLQWPPAHPLTVSLATNVAIIARPGGRTAVTRQGHLRLPAAVRHACRLKAGDRLLVATVPDLGMLVAYTMRALDEMVLAYHTRLHGENRR